MNGVRTNSKIGLVAVMAMALCIGCLVEGGGVRNGHDETHREDSSPSYDTGDGNVGSNIGFGGEQDFAYFRTQLDNGVVPDPDVLQASGFFAEHHTSLPPPECGQTLCLHPMLGVAEDPLGGEPRTVLQIGLNTPIELNPDERPDLDLSLSIDVSGSMSADNRIGYVRSGLELMLDELFDDDRVAIIIYSSDASVLLPMTRVGDSREEIREHIQSLQAGGMTALYAGLELAYQESLEHFDPEREARVIMLSDGQANVGPSADDEILSMSREYNDEGIGLTTIGLGSSFNVDLMRGLAEQGEGNFYYVGSAADVEDVFTVEVHSFTVPVARDVLIEVEEGFRYTFQQSWGSPHWEDLEDGGTLALPSVFAAWRTSHDDTTDSGGRRGGGSALLLELAPRDDVPEDVSEAEVARITLSYEDPELGEYVEETTEVVYPYHPTFLMAGGYFSSHGQGVIMKSFAMLHAYLALKEGCRLFHEGEAEEAIELLSAVQEPLSDLESRLNDGEGDEDIERDIELIEQLREVIEAHL